MAEFILNAAQPSSGGTGSDTLNSGGHNSDWLAGEQQARNLGWRNLRFDGPATVSLGGNLLPSIWLAPQSQEQAVRWLEMSWRTNRGTSPLSHLHAINEGEEMALDGNRISCDGYGCRTQDSFEGVLAPEEIRLRYHILGWQISETSGRETHFCPDHSQLLSATR